MLVETFADTSAIRALGHATAAAADDLAAIAADLSSLLLTAASGVFGPVGAEFVAALADAAAHASQEVAQLGERVASAVTAEHASADAYETAEDRAVHLLAASAAAIGLP